MFSSKDEFERYLYLRKTTIRSVGDIPATLDRVAETLYSIATTALDLLDGDDEESAYTGQGVEFAAGEAGVELAVCANLLRGIEPEDVARELRDMPEDPAEAYDVPEYARSNWSTRPFEHPGAKEVKPTPE